MKVRVILGSLSLLMFIFCTVGLSQAALDARHIKHVLHPVEEHPWQESGSPPFDDTIGPDAISPILIVIGPVKLIMIKPSRAESVPNENRRMSNLQMERILTKNTMPNNKGSR